MGEESSFTKKVTLRTSDGEVFDVEQTTIASQSQMISYMVEENCANDVIPLPTVTARVLFKVIEYCNKHAKGRGRQKDNNDLKGWDREFLSGMDINLVFELVLAANYLDINGLLDLTCQYMADHINYMTPEVVRKVFNIENDFTPEEEAKFREENEWTVE